MSLGNVTMGRGDSTYFCHIPLNFIPYVLCIAYSKTRMFKRSLQQTSYVVCHEKRGIPSTSGWPAGQALKICPTCFPILLKHCCMFPQTPNSRQNWTQAPQLSSISPQPRVQIQPTHTLPGPGCPLHLPSHPPPVQRSCSLYHTGNPSVVHALSPEQWIKLSKTAI